MKGIRNHFCLGAALYLQELMTTVRTTMTVKTAFGEPLERDGVTLIPVALVSGGGGAGGGEDEKGASGDGGGYGMCAQPVGMYVITNGRVRFRPVINVNQLVSSVGKAVAVAMFVRARVVRARTKKRLRDTH